MACLVVALAERNWLLTRKRRPPPAKLPRPRPCTSAPVRGLLPVPTPCPQPSLPCPLSILIPPKKFSRVVCVSFAPLALNRLFGSPAVFPTSALSNRPCLSVPVRVRPCGYSLRFQQVSGKNQRPPLGTFSLPLASFAFRLRLLR